MVKRCDVVEHVTEAPIWQRDLYNVRTAFPLISRMLIFCADHAMRQGARGI
jgi:hypothetical protein